MGLLFFISAQDVVVIPPDPGGEVVVVNISSVYDIDPYLDQTVLLLHGDRLVDECGKQITAVNDAKISSTQMKFGTGSLYVDGNGDYFHTTDTSLALGSGDFTIEAFHYISGTVNYEAVICGDVVWSGGHQGGWFLFVDAQRALGFNYGGTNYAWYNLTSANGIVTTNVWNHIAAVRKNGVLTLYLNGISVASIADSTNYTTGRALRIGAFYVDGGNYNRTAAYIDELRITKGVARYTNNFAVPSKAFPDYQYSDPEWDATVLLLRGEGYNGSTNIKDDTGRIITSNSLAISTTQKKYGNSSLYVNNTSANLSVSGNNIFGSNVSYTIECWVYVTAVNGGDNMTLLTYNNNSYPSRWAIDFASTSTQITMRIVTESNGVVFNSTAGNAALNNWHHLAYVNDAVSNTFKMYLNGVLVGSRAAVTLSAQSTIQLFKQSGAASSCNYYVDDFRIYQGYAKYQSAFTPVQQTLPSVFPTYEQYADSTVLLINGNGVNNSTNITDATGKTITVNGNARISTAQSKFNGSSIYFDGDGDYLTCVPTSNWDSQGLDYTIEMWINLSSVQTPLISCHNSSDSIGSWSMYAQAAQSDSSKFNISMYCKTPIGAFNQLVIMTNNIFSLNTWYHISLVKYQENSNHKVTIYVNGILESTGVLGSSIFGLSSEMLHIGRAQYAIGGTLSGYLQDIRITKGIARYTANFTPPTESFKYITNQPTIPYYDYYYDNVSLLLKGEGGSGLQNNKFIDSSSQNQIITVTGTISQGSVGPYTGFNSAYFNGASNYISSTSTNLAFGTSNFTIEGYFNTLSSGQQMIMDTRPAGVSSGIYPGVQIYLNKLWFGHANATFLTSTTTILTNTWYQFAIVRSSGVTKMYINGILEASINDTNTYVIGASRPVFGFDTLAGGNYLVGYISNLHITKSAKYTTDFIPSTTPVTTDANTVLLLNFDQAAIVDSTRKCNIATYGNTTVSNKTRHYANSIYFDGTGDYLVPTNHQLFAFGTDDFTVEFWMNSSNAAATYVLFDARPLNVNGEYLQLAQNASGQIYLYKNSVIALTSSISIISNTWNHIVLTRKSGTSTIYINGVNVASGTDTTNYQCLAGRPLIAGHGGNPSTFAFNGYLQDVRVTKGIARYTANFTPPYFEHATNRFDYYDSYWKNNVLLIHGEGPNNSTNINDITGKAITVVGTTKISTTKSKFGNGSIFFNGVGNYLSFANSTDFDFGSNDYTIEFWINTTQTTVTGLWGTGTNASASMNLYSINLRADGKIQLYACYVGNVGFDVGVSTSVVNDGVWNHVAISRGAGTTRMFINGKAEVTVTTAYPTYSPTATKYIGLVDWSGGGSGINTALSFTGYLQDYRITKGIARYTKNFAPLQSRTPNPISNFDPYYDNVTILLKGEGDNNSTTITDQKGHTITANGNAKISTTQSKFGTSSIAFDGTGDYLSIPTNTDVIFENDFTIEGWIYYNSLTSTDTDGYGSATFYSIGNNGTAGTISQFSIALYNSNVVVSNSNNGSGGLIITSNISVSINTWYHIAVTRQSSSLKLFINGVLVGSTTLAGTIGNINWSTYFGRQAYQYTRSLNGYLDDIRITKGIARYTNNFSVPVNTYPTYYPDSYLVLNTTTAYSTIKSSSLIANNGQGSIEGWINYNSSTGRSIFYSESGTGSDAGVFLAGIGSIAGIGAANKLTFVIYNGAWYGTTSTTSLSTGNWYHIVITWSTAKEVKIYINGVLDQTATITAVIPGNVVVKSEFGYGTSNNIMSIDKFRIYNTVIDQTKVTDHYNSGTPLYVTSDTNMIAGYNFNSNTNNIHDVSNTGNDFILGSGCVIQPYNI